MSNKKLEKHEKEEKSTPAIRNMQFSSKTFYDDDVNILMIENIYSNACSMLCAVPLAPHSTESDNLKIIYS